LPRARHSRVHLKAGNRKELVALVENHPAPAAPATSDHTTWSADAMIERLGGDEALARQLVTLFLGEYPRLLDILRTSLTSGVADDIRRAAHAAKGCIANFVEGGPQATACRIEQLATAGSLGNIPPLVAQLEQEVAALARDMTPFEQEKKKCAS
jgi:HPt (histidine-containing phosphotransfer) domain-containing protein